LTGIKFHQGVKYPEPTSIQWVTGMKITQQGVSLTGIPAWEVSSRGISGQFETEFTFNRYRAYIHMARCILPETQYDSNQKAKNQITHPSEVLRLMVLLCQ
jgi:hypothetical protein